MKQHTYIAIDLKSLYASVECRERGLAPVSYTHLWESKARNVEKYTPQKYKKTGTDAEE